MIILMALALIEVDCTYFTNRELPYNLRKGSILHLPRINSTYNDTNTVHSRGSLVWNNLPAVIKSTQWLGEFKRKIKNHGNTGCGCLIYK